MRLVLNSRFALGRIVEVRTEIAESSVNLTMKVQTLCPRPPPPFKSAISGVVGEVVGTLTLLSGRVAMTPSTVGEINITAMSEEDYDTDEDGEAEIVE